MAFYSVRVDDEWREIETTRQTYRKLYVEPVDNENVNKRSPNTFTTVRYVNSATFIEKDCHTVKKTEKIEEQNDSEDDTNWKEFNFPVETNERQYQSHITSEKFNESVPVLELNSSESFPSSNNLTYSYRKVREVTKIIQKPDAYREWLDAKRTAKLFEQRKREDKALKENEKKERRKKEAERKYRDWVANKERYWEEIKKQLAEKQNTTSRNDGYPEERGSDPNYKAWLERKLRHEKIQKKKSEEELRHQEKLNKLRKEKSAAVYKDWLKTAPLKPKPVPLNRGMFSLKGSISEMYINPVPWTDLDPNENSK